MPIHLKGPEYRPGGPDGKGWNRLSLNAHMGTPADRCALRPRTYAALVESQDTRRAEWGGSFDRCTGNGNCTACSILASPPGLVIPWAGDRVLVRIEPRDFVDRLHLMRDPDAGWDSPAVRVAWDAVAQMDGWFIGRQHRDAHGDGFWLVRAAMA